MPTRPWQICFDLASNIFKSRPNCHFNTLDSRNQTLVHFEEYRSHMKICSNLIVALPCLVAIMGCNSQADKLSVLISDPDCRASFEVPIRSDGSFEQTFSTDKVSCAAKGKITETQADVYEVDMTYSRTEGASTEKIEVEFTAKSDAEVPIGKNPTQSSAQPSTPNKLEKLTVLLVPAKE